MLFCSEMQELMVFLKEQINGNPVPQNSVKK
jgi:hypothetical protein